MWLLHDQLDWNISRQKVEWVRESIKTTMERNIPCSTTSFRFNLPWFNRAHRWLCKKKKRLYYRAKRSSNETDWVNYRSVKKKLKHELIKERNEYVTIFLTIFRRTLSPFGLIYRKPSVMAKLVLISSSMGDWRVTPISQANALNDHFCSLFTKEHTTTCPILPPFNCTTNMSVSKKSYRISNARKPHFPNHFHRGSQRKTLYLEFLQCWQ